MKRTSFSQARSGRSARSFSSTIAAPPRRFDRALTGAAALALGVISPAVSSCGSRSGSAAPSAGASASAPRELPPPVRPSALLGQVHLGQPRATGRAVGRIAGLPLPLDLLLVAQFGVESSLMTAVDLARPVDLLILGPVEHPHLVASFVPTATNTLRPTLSARFRMTPVEGLGERLDPRAPDGPSAREESARRRRPQAYCAIVPVPTDVALPSRIVCADDAESLASAGRFAAFSSRDHADERDDFVLRLEGTDARTVLARRLRTTLTGLTDDLAASASAARRERERAPDLGDPEILVGLLRETSEHVEDTLRDVRALTLRGAVQPEGVLLTVELPLDPAGTTALANDARARTGAPHEHALAARVASDAVAVLAGRASGERTRAQVTALAEMVLSVLGDRVADPSAARNDLRALFAQTDDAVALSVTPETPAQRPGAAPAPSAAPSASAARPDERPEALPALEVLAVLSQRDRGVAARAAIAQLARAPWFRTARLGASPLAVRAGRDGALIVRLPPAASGAGAAPPSRVGASAAPPREPVELGIAVVSDALVFVVSPHVERALAAIPARATAGVLPRALAAVRPPAAVSFAFDPAPLMDPSMRGAEEDRARNVFTVTYDAQAAAQELTARVQLRVPGSALMMLRRALPGGPGRRRRDPMRGPPGVDAEPGAGPAAGAEREPTPGP